MKGRAQRVASLRKRARLRRIADTLAWVLEEPERSLTRALVELVERGRQAQRAS
jgi:hypothetical protein